MKNFTPILLIVIILFGCGSNRKNDPTPDQNTSAETVPVSINDVSVSQSLIAAGQRIKLTIASKDTLDSTVDFDWQVTYKGIDISTTPTNNEYSVYLKTDSTGDYVVKVSGIRKGKSTVYTKTIRALAPNFAIGVWGNTMDEIRYSEKYTGRTLATSLIGLPSIYTAYKSLSQLIYKDAYGYYYAYSFDNNNKLVAGAYFNTWTYYGQVDSNDEYGIYLSEKGNINRLMGVSGVETQIWTLNENMRAPYLTSGKNMAMAIGQRYLRIDSKWSNDSSIAELYIYGGNPNSIYLETLFAKKATE